MPSREVLKIESSLNKTGNTSFWWDVDAEKEKCNEKLAAKHIWNISVFKR